MNSKTNIQLIFSLCVALVAGVGFVFSSYYINGLTEKTSTLQEEIETKEIKIKRIQNVNKSAEKTNMDREKLANFFIDSNKAIDFVSMLESQASKIGLQYVTNSIENVEMENLSIQNKQLLRISMSLSGGWRSILTYLLYIESLPYALNVEKMELASEGVATPNTQTGAQVGAQGGVRADSMGSTSLAGTSSTKSVPVVRNQTDSRWKLGITFSVVKVKDKK